MKQWVYHKFKQQTKNENKHVASLQNSVSFL